MPRRAAVDPEHVLNCTERSNSIVQIIPIYETTWLAPPFFYFDLEVVGMRRSFWLCLLMSFSACDRGALPLPPSGPNGDVMGAPVTAPWPMVGGGPMHQLRNLQQRKNDPMTQAWDFQADGVVRGSCVVA